MTVTSPQYRFVFAGGGTGGHLFPAVAIADRLRELLQGKGQVQIVFVGTRRGLEYRRREQLGYPLHLINIRGIVRSFTLKNLLVPFLVVTSLWQASRLLRRFRPQVVIGTGGYVAWPVGRAAIGAGIPLVLQEQNSYPGIVTRRLA
ncbi:MAG: UDP-N-acetylglucosamine--N-acetylmuramyl-(pentapeptide) pyrophosphoryl-undecaprenol N-acetylglucosamine transferase, partial [Candidatus Zixiibacteriota bacterium]